MQGTFYENKIRICNNRIDAYGLSDIRKYQIGRDSQTGLEYIVVATRIIEEDAA